MKKIVLVACMSIIGLLCFGQAEEDIVRELLTLTRSDALALQMVDMMLPSLQKLAPDVPAWIWQEIRGRIKGDDLIEMMIPLYQKHYSQQEMLELISFYKSAVGQKTIAETPAIMNESNIVAQEWGIKVAGEIVQMIMEKGYKLNPL